MIDSEAGVDAARTELDRVLNLPVTPVKRQDNR